MVCPMLHCLPVVAALLSGALMLALAPGSAAAGQRAAEPAFAVTPMIGHRGGGRVQDADTDRRRDVSDDTALALSLNLLQLPGRFYEAFYSRQSTALAEGGVPLRVEYLHVGGIVTGAQAAWVPYLAGGAGGTRFAPREAGRSSHMRLSFSLAVGAFVPLAERLSLRLEARAYATLTDGDTGFLCVSGQAGGACAARYEGSAFWQGEALAGLTWRF